MDVDDASKSREDLHAEVATLRARLAAASEGEVRFRAFFDAIPTKAWVLHPDGSIDFFNRRWMDYTGQPQRLPGLSWMEAIHPDDRPLARARRESAIPLGESYEVELRIRDTAGDYRWHVGRVSPIRDAPGGPVTAWLGTAADIHEVRLAQDAARRHALFLDQAGEAAFAWSLDGDGGISYWNRAAEELYGHPAADALGKPKYALLRTVFPQSRDHLLAALRRDGAWRGELIHTARDGRRLTVESRMQVVREADGRAVVLETARDVTARNAAEQARRDSEAKLQAVIDGSTAVVYAKDLAGRYLLLNRRFQELFNVSQEEGRTRTDHDLFPRETADEVTAHDRRVVAENRTILVEETVTHPDGTIHTYVSSKFPLRDAAGAIYAVCGVSTDVTDRKAAEQAARAAREEAERANRAKDEFLAALSHELRTPLAPVLLTTQMLESDPTVPESVRDDIAVIRRNVEIEVRLIDDLLDLTRVARGKVHLQSAAADLHAVLRHAIDTCRDDTFLQKRLDLRLDLAAADTGVWADAPRLGQIFWNLVKNAVKFTPAGGAITVRTANPAPGHVAVTVADTGCGIPPHVLPAIFNAFEQGGPDVTRQFGGLGLGLAISRALVELHGGEITVTSAGRGLGATFTVTLPTCPLPAVARGSAGAKPSTPALTPRATNAPDRNKRILLVEDHRHSGLVLRRLLTRLGYDVEWADTAAAALRAADHVADQQSHAPFDLVISDVGLPDSTGHDLMRELRRRHNLRGIALTGYGMDDDLARSADAGFLRHLVKPVSLPLLQATLQDLVG